MIYNDKTNVTEYYVWPYKIQKKRVIKMNLWCFRGEQEAVKVKIVYDVTTVALLIPIHPSYCVIMCNMMQCHCLIFTISTS